MCEEGFKILSIERKETFNQIQSWFEQWYKDNITKNNKIEKWYNNRMCTHPEHNFPSMLYIPPGQKYTHTCPACGQKTTVIGKRTYL